MNQLPAKKRNEFGLTELEERFCQEYLIDLNATAALTRAGSKANKDSIRAEASQMLTKVDIRTRIVQLTKERSRRTNITADNVLQEIAVLAFHNIEDYCDWDEEGNLTIKPGKEIPRQLKAAIRSIKKIQKKIPVKNGDPIEINRLELKLTGKEKNLEMLMRHLGLFNDKLNLQGKVKILYNIIGCDNLEKPDDAGQGKE